MEHFRELNAFVKRAVVAVFLCMLLVVCAEKPMTLIDAAAQALQEAKAAGAKVYAQQILIGAETAFLKAQEELAIEEDRFAWQRNYDSVQVILETARNEANRAKSEALKNRDQAKAGVQTTILKAEMLLDEVRMRMAEAPMSKRSQADLQALASDLETAEYLLGELNAVMAREDFLGAKAQAHAIESFAARVHKKVTQALRNSGKAKS